MALIVSGSVVWHERHFARALGSRRCCKPSFRGQRQVLELFCWQQHSFDGAVRHEMKLIVCFCGHFKFAEGVASKFPVFIAAFKIISLVPFCTVLSNCTSKKQRFVEVPLERRNPLGIRNWSSPGRSPSPLFVGGVCVDGKLSAVVVGDKVVRGATGGKQDAWCRRWLVCHRIQLVPERTFMVQGKGKACSCSACRSPAVNAEGCAGARG